MLPTYRMEYAGGKRRAHYSKEHKVGIKKKKKRKTFSPFLLFTVDMVYKVTKNTKLVNTKLLLVGEIQH